MPKRDQAAIKRALSDGEWLQIGDLMILFDASRSMVDRWLSEGVRVAGPERMKIRYKVKAGGARIADPDDVRAVLAETDKVRDYENPDGISAK